MFRIEKIPSHDEKGNTLQYPVDKVIYNDTDFQFQFKVIPGFNIEKAISDCLENKKSSFEFYRIEDHLDYELIAELEKQAMEEPEHQTK